jgi:hypothetical protein
MSLMNIDGEKVLAPLFTAQGLISRICKEFKNVNTKETNNPMTKWANELNTQFSNEEV